MPKKSSPSKKAKRNLPNCFSAITITITVTLASIKIDFSLYDSFFYWTTWNDLHYTGTTGRGMN